MFLLEADLADCSISLLAAGSEVNRGEDALAQSPAHLAAGGGEAFCLLWLLHTGADPNLQDAFGETPVHKAARVGSLECISALVASDAQLDIRDHEGRMAEDVAWASGYQDCGRLLSMLRSTRRSAQPESACGTVGLLKRGHSGTDTWDGKRARER